jgi:uncharacterized protein (TIGR02246 family)
VIAFPQEFFDMFTSRWVPAAVLVWSLISAPAFADEAAVRKSLKGYVEAFNLHDAKATASFWTETGVHRNEATGEEISGRAAMEADLASVFKLRPTSRLEARLDKLRMIRPDVARGEGEAILTGGGEDPSVSRFTVILIVSEGKWLIDSVDERPAETESTAVDALAELDWLVGAWNEENADGRLDTAFRRTSGGAFLLRSFAFTSAEGALDEGSQVIGWDPIAKQIRSWSFHSDGSFGEGLWSRNGDAWLIRSTHTLPDGRVASGTYVLTPEGDDALTFQLVGHEIDGEPQPTAPAATLHRVVPPAEAAVEPAVSPAPPETK